MSWMAKLYETYDHVVTSNQEEEEAILWPISHFVKNAHIEVVIDVEGNFLKGRSKILHGSDSPTLIPASESSAGRAGAKIAPHPLCEEIGYCASDYPKANKNKTQAYLDQMRDWANSSKSHPKLKAIFKYLEKQTLWNDLSSEFEFPLKVKKSNGTSQKISPEKVFIRWCVEEPGNPVSGTWQDEELIDSWISYDREKNSKKGFCYILGDKARIASNHPRFLRWPGDGAKLVSSNDHSGYTFRGKFTDTKTSIDKHGAQAVVIGFDVTQKAHNALRYLLSSPSHSYRNGDQVYITWAVSGKKIPELLKSSWAMMTDEDIFLQPEIEPEESQDRIDQSIDIGASFAFKFNNYLRGYRAKLEPNEQIVIMGLDSATPGRMGIIYYRELLASEFLDRIHDWHIQFAWPQRHTKEYPNPNSNKKPIRKTIWPVSSPVPRVIAEAAYGDILKSNKTLNKSLLERILPCIVDGRQFPRDVMLSAVRRASNCTLKRLSQQFSNPKSEKAAWEKNLGVACALYRGFYMRHPDKIKRREYSMTLEEDRKTRDYLYGRLLAIAERIEEVALNVGGESRPTTAARLMQRFADRPFSTWRNIELGLQPYMQGLQGKRAGFLTNCNKELDAVQDAFSPDDFTSDKPLSGEFLLGYHCQKQDWRNKKETNNEN
ncbi:type I-C CRISPR-associated protein Cas8c/Csd1 [Desulfobacula sp.]|uniref:type I-C CRISPR-associated protein Cas8c/Csd1 n=1 Tax=Desulfobacula sp. TaxID=2593537 RepID=UPI0025BFAA41|nr:type I-C CRISPR-associated protein Cas8c/Csd1 [Desulfobacula sp.]MBC2705981.1 type I-C CRISPR-associated protein Cas8c/Csd1 [Desulfobacula sp.]